MAGNENQALCLKKDMDLSSYHSDNGVNYTASSELPKLCLEEPCCLGIDEAGRGPVLGPMVYGCCFSPLSKKEELKNTGVADSKTLTEEQRESLFDKIHENADKIGWMVEVLSPNYISNCMLRRFKYNLNTLSHDTAIGLIRKALDKGVDVQEVYVDTVGLPEKYQAKLEEIFPNIKITVAKKADSIYPIVSAASICAKVARDRTVKCWQFQESIELDDKNYGSGYPSDPNTKKFMATSIDPIFGFPQFVRFSWSTASTILDEKAVPISWEDDDEDENESQKKMPSVSQYFKPKDENRALKKHAYFRDRALKTVTFF